MQCNGIMEWNHGMESWNGMEWNGMEWNGMEWNGMQWNHGMESWNGIMEWNHVKWVFYMRKYLIYAHRESNPSLVLGREAFYLYTMCAWYYFFILFCACYCAERANDMVFKP